MNPDSMDSLDPDLKKSTPMYPTSNNNLCF